MLQIISPVYTYINKRYTTYVAYYQTKIFYKIIYEGVAGTLRGKLSHEAIISTKMKERLMSLCIPLLVVGLLNNFNFCRHREERGSSSIKLAFSKFYVKFFEELSDSLIFNLHSMHAE